MTFNSTILNLSSGVGTVASPAIYSNGNCPNSQPNTFSGVITINGQICNYAGGILPVVYEDYKVIQQGLNTIVKWTTLVEVNVSKYEVYLSFDAVNWSMIREIPSAGNTRNKIEYSCKLDVSNNPPLFYVKVIEVDMDGTKQEFETLEVRKTSNTPFHFYPNPTNDYLYLDVAVQAVISVRSLSNSEVIDQVQYAGNVLDLSQLPSGLYFVSLFNGVGLDVIKVFKK